jgi:hypothetical protein
MMSRKWFSCCLGQWEGLITGKLAGVITRKGDEKRKAFITS